MEQTSIYTIERSVSFTQTHTHTLNTLNTLGIGGR